ncbi:MAG: protein XagA [Acidobacteriota bacterium]|jgi:hypothetical protein|nr:protein XagA [Acidobacteriota bacterium]
MKTYRQIAGATLLLFLTVSAGTGFCGGAWVPAPGDGDVQLGFSRKTASTSWNASGDSFQNTTVRDGETKLHYHDFRYGYLSGEVGLLPRLSTRFVTTYLYGLEGPHDDLEKNSGLSDAWFGLKYALAQGDWPMALAGTVRTPYFYDLPGAYNRYLFDANGQRRGVSPEWRGVLKHDYTLTYLLSHSMWEGRGWMNLEAGYTWREGAPADQLPISAELGWPLPFAGAAVKGSLVYVGSLGNDSLREPDDRFGANATFNFNDASMARVGVSLILPVQQATNIELGYNQWVWGESARRYDEPFLSVGYRF